MTVSLRCLSVFWAVPARVSSLSRLWAVGLCTESYAALTRSLVHPTDASVCLFIYISILYLTIFVCLSVCLLSVY